jgi:hypothetical protein
MSNNLATPLDKKETYQLVIDGYKFHQSVHQRRFIVLLVITVLLFLVYFCSMYMSIFNSDIRVPIIVAGILISGFWIYFGYKNLRYHSALLKEIAELERNLFEKVSATEMKFAKWSTTVKLFDIYGISEFIISVAALVVWIVLSFNYINANTDMNPYNGILILMMLVPLFLIIAYILRNEFSPIKEKTEE